MRRHQSQLTSHFSYCETNLSTWSELVKSIANFLIITTSLAPNNSVGKLNWLIYEHLELLFINCKHKFNVSSRAGQTSKFPASIEAAEEYIAHVRYAMLRDLWRYLQFESNTILKEKHTNRPNHIHGEKKMKMYRFYLKPWET